MRDAYRARVTSKGRVTTPKPVRQALGVQPGDDVSFEIDAGGVRVHPVRAAGRFRAFAGRWRAGTGWSQAQTDAWVREVRGGRDAAHT